MHRISPCLRWLQPALLVAAVSVSANTAIEERPINLVRTGLPHDALYDIAFTDGVGFAVGRHGAVLTSENGGLDWQAVDVVTDQAMLAVEALDNRIVMVGQQGSIFVGDRASALQRIESPTSELLMSVALDASGLAVAVGGFGTVLVSRDAGTSWEQKFLDWGELQPEGLEAHLYDISITAEGEILLCGEFAMILASSDQGETWELRHLGDASLFAMHLSDNGAGFAVGQEGTVLRTMDDGRSWQAAETNSTANLLDVWQSDQGEVVAIGIRALLRSSDAGTTWVAVQDTTIDRAWYAALSPGILTNSIDNGTLSAQLVYAVGQQGNIIIINQ